MALLPALPGDAVAVGHYSAAAAIAGTSRLFEQSVPFAVGEVPVSPGVGIGGAGQSRHKGKHARSVAMFPCLAWHAHEPRQRNDSGFLIGAVLMKGLEL